MKHVTQTMFALLPLLLALSACPAATTASTAPLDGTAAHATTCAQASLAIANETVVGTFDGKPITYGDLGVELKKAEGAALQEYCESVHARRAIALDNYVTEKLVDAAAKKANKDVDSWMRDEIAARQKAPSDAEMRAFYDTRKRDGAPAFDDIKDAVMAAMMREQGEKVVGEIVSDLKKGTAYQKSLPDVRPPAKDVDIPATTAIKGSKSAKVKIVEFADFQCPYCSRAGDALHAVAAKYGDKVEIAYRHFPLKQIHPNAQGAAEVAQCALRQNKFWELHDRMYADQSKLDRESLIAAAKEVGVDQAKLEACLSSGEAAGEVERDAQRGDELGVQGTPTIFINGRQHAGATTVEALSESIDEALAL